MANALKGHSAMVNTASPKIPTGMNRHFAQMGIRAQRGKCAIDTPPVGRTAAVMPIVRVTIYVPPTMNFRTAIAYGFKSIRDVRSMPRDAAMVRTVPGRVSPSLKTAKTIIKVNVRMVRRSMRAVATLHARIRGLMASTRPRHVKPTQRTMVFLTRALIVMQRCTVWTLDAIAKHLAVVVSGREPRARRAVRMSNHRVVKPVARPKASSAMATKSV